MKTIAIYHEDCIDGTTAAAVVLRKFPDALLFPLNHGYTPEELQPILGNATVGDRIFTVDCVIGAKEFLAAGFPVISIDHHIGAREEYKKLADEDPKFTYVFDNEKSGASLAWSYFFPGEKMPEIVKFAEDRDLWRWKYAPDTEYVTNYLWLSVNKPEESLTLFTASTETLDALKKEGAAISRFTKNIIDHVVDEAEPLMLSIGTYKVPTYNTTVFKSEIGNLMSIKQNQAVGLFSIKDDEVRISFRSKDGQSPSALDLAKLIGGGGHVNAAAGSMSLADFWNALEK